MRIDKWLWAARFFKTRALASKACDLGRIHVRDLEAKPARDIHVGDMLHIKNEGGDYEVEVLALSEMRGPASVAHTLYRETEASKEARQKAAEERKAMQQFMPLPNGGPANATAGGLSSFAGAVRRLLAVRISSEGGDSSSMGRSTLD